MVAVAVVAVMSGGTSSAQTALETTLAREEIDAQAEALRFIQASYIADKNAGDESKYSELWENITSRAYNKDNVTNISEDLSKYSPASCSDLYEGSNPIPEAKNYGFILNTRTLGTFVNPEDVVADSDKLEQAYTYPRLVFNDSGQLASDSFNNSLRGAEGIYIIAVKDPESTVIAGSNSKESAYFDFYIRTCWYGTGDQNPSTISTVMRLYDPDAIKEIEIAPPTPDEPPTPDDTYLSDNEYVINESGEFAIIDGRHYGRDKSDIAILGFVCHTWPDSVSEEFKEHANKSYVGPVLVSTSSTAVGYKTEGDISGTHPWTSGDTFTYNGRSYFYSSWVHWMRVNSGPCSDAKNMITYSKIGDYKLYTFDQPKTAQEAVREAAKRLIQDATSD